MKCWSVCAAPLPRPAVTMTPPPPLSEGPYLHAQHALENCSPLLLLTYVWSAPLVPLADGQPHKASGVDRGGHVVGVLLHCIVLLASWSGEEEEAKRHQWASVKHGTYAGAGRRMPPLQVGSGRSTHALKWWWPEPEGCPCCPCNWHRITVRTSACRGYPAPELFPTPPPPSHAPVAFNGCHPRACCSLL